MEISFCSLRAKQVVNICDGKVLGNVIDLIFDTCCARIIGMVVPCEKSFLGIFKNGNNIFIPYNRICKIGKDIIIVELNNPTDCCSNNTNILEIKNDSTDVNYKPFNSNYKQ